MNPICPTGCNTSQIKPVYFSNCAPEINYSEIQHIYFAKPNAAAFSDWTSPTEWATRLSNATSSGNDYIRKLTVIADKPAPTQTKIDVSNDRSIVTNKSHVLNVTIDETNSVNHEFLRYLECGGQVKMWYETKAGLLFGGNNGINGTAVLDMVNPRGKDSIMTYAGTVTWDSKFTEERTVSPIVDADEDLSTETYSTPLGSYASATTHTVSGITGLVPAADTDLAFEFNPITPLQGSDMTMVITVNGTTAITVTFKSDYLGGAFHFIDASANDWYGVFTSGTVAFS